MAFDQATRNRLARFVGDSRTLLTDEFTRQLQHEYGIDPASGEVASLDRLSHLDDSRRETAVILRDTLAHYMAGQPKQTAKVRQDMIDRIIREQAFTVLNRLCALRMMEARGLLLESVFKGYQSRGFQLYSRLAGTALGETGDTYRSYLASLFDEFAVDLPVLFDRFSPQGRLFPRPASLLHLLDEINHPDIDPLWAEDETIGWIYQYFNSVEERRQMRAASQAPRNSRELAVRNQFFTPRYVVEFLTDNTLGRIWYEMTQGETALAENCRYLVRRPHEIFLAKGEAAPAQPEDEADLSQEELLQQPVYIPYRPIKDPRDIKMLDPACGSMHFGLYAFDLYEQIYAEAWALEASRSAHTFTRPEELDALHKTYADETAFRRDIPRLIIEHNIHGIDIDPRAVQIAGLSLWLRAQKNWQAAGVKPQDRPTVTRSNVVTAEPMPGDTELLNEFIEQYLADTAENRLLGQLVKRVFESMKLAGEAGSLLKIEEEIDADITEAKEKWYAKPQPKQSGLFEDRTSQSKPEPAPLDVTGITDEAFWDQTKERIYEALQNYAEQAENGNSFRRRLFSEDAVRGFAFIDLCRQLYDVVLMNPPFGDGTSNINKLNAKHYSRPRIDLGMAFIESLAEKLRSNARIGAITSRTFVANETLEDWRENYLLGEKCLLNVIVDLGIGVLDDALVEVAAYVLSKSKSALENPLFIKVLDEREKELAVKKFFDEPSFQNFERTTFHIVPIYFFKRVSNKTLCYWLPNSLMNQIISAETLSDIGGISRRGPDTGDDFRFLRLYWEINPTRIGVNHDWVFFAKGGEYQPLYDDIHLMLKWKNEGWEIRNFTDEKGRQRSRPQGIEHLFHSGITYPRRTTSDISPRILPDQSAFGGAGQAIFLQDRTSEIKYLVGSCTRAYKLMIEALVGSGDSAFSGSAANLYRTGLLEAIPHPLSKYPSNNIDLAKFAIEQARDRFKHEETARNFWVASLATPPNQINLQTAYLNATNRMLDTILKQLEYSNLFDQFSINEQFRMKPSEVAILDTLVGVHPNSYTENSDLVEDLDQYWNLSDKDLVSLAVNKYGARRQITKLSFFVDRRIELLSHILQAHPKELVEKVKEVSLINFNELLENTGNLVSWLIGCVVARWDIRYATSQKELTQPPDLFAPLAICSPGMLQNNLGMPATSDDVSADYPLRISWPGILVDDPGHLDDIESRFREASRIIWQNNADAIEQEVCQILGISSLRTYFSNPNNFFNDHLKRYSKSRRYAPIYWPLSTPSGSYTLWLYYHRIDEQILYTAINNFVDPKLKDVSQQVNNLRQKTSRSKTQEDDLTRLSDLEAELKEFRTELLRIASFWRPDLNDGVQITAAPLWRLFQHRQWQNKLKDTWDSLETGEYDWAHLAMSIWPERVVPKCVTDRSLAITHDLENLFWVEDDGNWRLLQAPDQEIAEQKKRRQITVHERLRQHLETLASGSGRGIPAYQVWQHLSEGNWDDTAVALALWPERVGEKCWDNPLMAAHLGLKSPPKRTKANRNRFLKRILEESTPELAQAVAAAFQDEEKAFDVVWQAIVQGDSDELPLALALWPARVVDKCATDANMAIHHDLHRYFWYQPPGGMWRRRKPQVEEIKEEIRRRQAKK